ncbi:hypothetical protein SAMN05428961_11356 [Paenibacillus sp. OK060]|nr:hypothetical protein SAMN05428961_11356 [Paenibacillus sp. OK060]
MPAIKRQTFNQYSEETKRGYSSAIERMLDIQSDHGEVWY